MITSLFTELGDLPNFSVLLLNQFLAGGMGEYPMAMVYESQYLSSVLTGTATDPNLTFMYPTPDVSSEDALVAWTPAGKKLIAALQSKPTTASASVSRAASFCPLRYSAMAVTRRGAGPITVPASALMMEIALSNRP